VAGVPAWFVVVTGRVTCSVLCEKCFHVEGVHIVVVVGIGGVPFNTSM